MYIDQELITKYNEKKSRGVQLALMKFLADRKIYLKQPVVSNIVNKNIVHISQHRKDIIEYFIKYELDKIKEQIATRKQKPKDVSTD